MDGKEAPADGVVTGYGKVDGRMVAVAAYDFTVMAGSMGMTGELKMARLREMALQKRMPLIWLLDSAGARIQEAAGSLFAGSGHLFREEVVMSGVVPQVAALMGPCAAGTAYIPGLADFVPMVKGRGSMALAGPHLTKAVTGEDVTQEELGGSRVHTRVSGVGDLEVDSDEDCIAAIKSYLSYMPRSCDEAPPIRETADPVDRRDEELLDILPESPRHPYDMYDVIRRIVDDGEWFDLKPRWARTIITCLARMGGRPVGIVANQPRHLGGILENDSADKAARFINLCDAYGIPLLFLMDVPGFMVGTKVERAGIIRHGAKMLYAVSRATVPKVTVIVRKAYGAGLLRDVRQGLRAGPDRGLAERRDLGDGPRGRGEHHLPQADRGGRGPGRGPRRDDRGDPGHDRSLHRRRQRPHRRRDRPARDAAHRDQRAGDGGHEEGPATPQEAWSDARMSSFEDPAIITCSISGAVANRDQCPAIPYTPEEYAAEARRAVDEGCSMIHIHARTPDGVPSYEIEDFRAITEAIRGAVDDVIINYSTGAIGVPIEKRIAYLRELRPDVAALNMSSMNYAKYSRSRKDFVFKAVFENSFDTIIAFLEAMNDIGIRPEHECFDSGHVANLDPLIDMGLLSEPLQVSCVMGVNGGIRPTPRNLAFMADQVPGGPEGPNNWGVIGISRDQWRLVSASAALGGNVRVGLEDNFYLPGGEMASSNGDLIARARRIVEDVGRRAATVAEARERLAVPAREVAA